jgi:hypothetical protein
MGDRGVFSSCCLSHPGIAGAATLTSGTPKIGMQPEWIQLRIGAPDAKYRVVARPGQGSVERFRSARSAVDDRGDFRPWR